MTEFSMPAAPKLTAAKVVKKRTFQLVNSDTNNLDIFMYFVSAFSPNKILCLQPRLTL